MGLMYCSRSDCESVMCQHMIMNRYICSDCMEELAYYRIRFFPQFISKIRARKLVEDFFTTEVGLYTDAPVDLELFRRQIKHQRV